MDTLYEIYRVAILGVALLAKMLGYDFDVKP